MIRAVVVAVCFQALACDRAPEPAPDAGGTSSPQQGGSGAAASSSGGRAPIGPTTASVIRPTDAVDGSLAPKKYEEGRWALGSTGSMTEPTVVRYRDDLDPLAGRPGWGTRLTLTWPYDPGVTGLPSDDLLDAMEKFETAAVPAIEKRAPAVCAAVRTSGGARAWIFYVRDRKALEKVVAEEIAASSGKGASLRVDWADDPTWSEYRALVESVKAK